MSQLTLAEAFDNAVTTGRDHPVSSRAAAARVLPRTGTQRWRVYQCIVGCGEHGATDDEIAVYLNLSGNSVRPRRTELHRQGLIVRAGRQRRNAAGNECDVWVVT